MADALQKLAGSDGALFIKLMKHGNMSVEIYRPVETDGQTPHLQDELYIVISGEGEFLNNGGDPHSDRATYSLYRPE